MKLGVRAAVRALLVSSVLVVGAAWACSGPLAVPRAAGRALLAESYARQTVLADGKERSQGCPNVAPSQVEGRVASNSIDELSGLVASRRHAGVFWVHNDSGDDARVFAIDAHGKTLAELALAGVDAHDIEDIALGKGERDVDVLYVADTGDNFKRRHSVRIYRVEEPTTLSRTGAPLELERSVSTYEVVYEDGPHDAETLLVDPTDGDLYLVAKAHLLLREEPVGVYRLARAQLSTVHRNVARKVAAIRLGPATGGDIAVDGSAVLVRNYWSAMYWPRSAGESIAQALGKPPCRLKVSDVGYQGEAIGFTPDGAAFVTMAEGDHPVIFRYPFVK